MGGAVSNAFEGVGNFIGDTVGSITGAKQAGQAGEKAGQLQYQAAMAGVDENKRQFDKLVELMAPFVSGGQEAFNYQKGLLGLNGPTAQSWLTGAIATSPMAQSLYKEGENAILQNAAATGGLRGGNVQGALANFRANMLNNLIQQQFQNLGGISQMGQSAAANQGAAGLQTGANVANLLQQGGAAQAGGIMSRGGVASSTFGNLLDLGSLAMGAKKAGMF